MSVLKPKFQYILISVILICGITHFSFNNSKFLSNNYNTFRGKQIFKVITCIINKTHIAKLYFYAISLLNFLTFAIINPSIKNPGPRNKGLSVMYQNVQGLIPFAYLSDQNPALDSTKIFELQAYVYSYKPDVVILNETWLKDSISDNELLSPKQYKVFRCDRTISTHPPDPLDPKKFRKNGGGVLIAVRTNLAFEVKRIKTKCKAEFLSIEIVTENNSKLIIATCYRVGTLGQENIFQIANTVHKLLRKKNLKKFVLIGDFNLPGIPWRSDVDRVTEPIKTSFINSFAENGLEQCITESTHRTGNILDLLLSTSINSIINLKVNDTPLCKSDHFSITFEVELKVKRRKPIKKNVSTSRRRIGKI